MEAIRVRYKLMLALFALLGGLLIMILAVLAGGDSLLVFVGLINATLGIAQLTRPAFIVYSDRVELRSVIGMTVRTHRFDSLADVEIRDGRLYRRGQSQPMKGAGGWYARASDLELVDEAIHNAQRVAQPKGTSHDLSHG